MSEEAVPQKIYVTFETYEEKCDAVINFLNEQIEKMCKEKKQGVRTLQKTRKMVVGLKKDIPKLKKRRRARKGAINSGLTAEVNISDELKSFLNLDRLREYNNLEEDQELSFNRNDITRALAVYIRYDAVNSTPLKDRWAYLNPGGTRNLQNPANKKQIIPDAKLSKLLQYKSYQKHVKEGKIFKKKKTGDEVEEVPVTDDGLDYCVMQRLITKHIFSK
jgi:hypothetical protein